MISVIYCKKNSAILKYSFLTMYMYKSDICAFNTSVYAEKTCLKSDS